MHYLLLGILLLILAYAALRAFLNANPKDLAKTLRKIGGVALLVLALFFAATGRFAVAVPVGIFALTLLGRGLAGGLGGFGPFPGSASKTAGQRSRVRTSVVEMELDHDTGEMDGTILAGPLQGQALSALARSDLLELLEFCRSNDTQAAQLVEAYLDRMHADWREDEDVKYTSSGTGNQASQGPMTREEAFEILGLQPGASRSDIRRAHRTLMKKLHPDQGGSTYLASRVNQAKDLLLG